MRTQGLFHNRQEQVSTAQQHEPPPSPVILHAQGDKQDNTDPPHKEEANYQSLKKKKKNEQPQSGDQEVVGHGTAKGKNTSKQSTISLFPLPLPILVCQQGRKGTTTNERDGGRLLCGSATGDCEDWQNNSRNSLPGAEHHAPSLSISKRHLGGRPGWKATR